MTVSWRHSGLNLRLINVEIGVDVLHVVVLFKGFDQPNHLRSLRTGELDVILRDHANFRGCWSDSRFAQRLFYLFHSLRRSHYVPAGAIVFQIFRASLENDVQHFVFAGLLLGNYDFALAVKHPADRAGFGEVAAVFGHQVAKFADDAVAIRGHHLDQHAHAARSIALEGGFLVLFAFELAGTAQDGALDVFIGHIFILAGQNRGAQARIRIRVASADARGNGDFADDASEHATALRVGGRFLVLDGGPL